MVTTGEEYGGPVVTRMGLPISQLRVDFALEYAGLVGLSPDIDRLVDTDVVQVIQVQAAIHLSVPLRV